MVFVWPNLWHVAHCDLVVYLPNPWHVAHYDLMVYFTKYITRGSLWACVFVVQMYEMWPTGNWYQYLCFLMCWPYSFNGFFNLKKKKWEDLNTFWHSFGTIRHFFVVVLFGRFLELFVAHFSTLWSFFGMFLPIFFGTFCNVFSCSQR